MVRTHHHLPGAFGAAGAAAGAAELPLYTSSMCVPLAGAAHTTTSKKKYYYYCCLRARAALPCKAAPRRFYV